MFKILIADDNPLIRMGLKNMIDWDRFQAVLAGEAGDGEEALEAIKREEPDMVITDIRMPGADGIYLLNQIKENYPQIITIVISAYNEFDYAKEAIRAGSIDYILKPIKPGELNETIARGVEKSRQEHEDAGFTSGREGAYTLLLLRTAKQYETEDIAHCLKDIQDVSVDKKGQLFVITAPCKEQISRTIREKLGEYLEEPYLLGADAAAPGESIQEASGRVLENAIEEMFRKNELEYAPYEGDCRDKEMLRLYCSAGDSTKVKEMFHGIVSESLEDVQFFNEMQKFLKWMLSFEKADFNRIREVMERIGQQKKALYYVTIGEIVEQVDEVIDALCAESGKSEGSKKELVSRVKEMVKKNYQSDISLSMIARLFYVSPAYLSRTFKQETGENLNHYITDIRMKNARELLENTDKKVVEVAEMVGYPDVVYFTKSYKKYFGYTPNANR